MRGIYERSVEAATIGEPGRARRGASGSLNPQSAIAGPNTVRGAESNGAWARDAGVDGQVPRTGSLRTASGPGGSSAKECPPGAAEPPDPSPQRRRRPSDSPRRRVRATGLRQRDPAEAVSGLLDASGRREVAGQDRRAALGQLGQDRPAGGERNLGLVVPGAVPL